jgi:hypothetical protein
LSEPPVDPWARACFTAGWLGELDGYAATHEALAARATPEAAAWRLALQGQQWLAQDSSPLPYGPSDLAPFVSRDGAARSAAAFACAMGGKASLLAFDIETLRAFSEVHERLDAPDPEARGWLEVTRGWLHVVECRAPGIEPELENTARSTGSAPLLVEVVALLALDRAHEADLEEATKLARRASRMARTEGMPQLEYVANVVLARIRRLTGSPHLAARILVALLRVASPAWHGWMEWELALATGGNRPSAASDCIGGLARAALAGNAAELRRWHAEALSRVGRTFLRPDLDVLRALCDLDAPAAETDLQAWLDGRASSLAPRGLHGVVSVPDRAYREDPVWVLGRPDRPGRRVLTIAEGLVRVAEPGVVVVAPSRKRRARTDAAVAALALLGPAWIDEVALFERLYGFTYQSSVHQGARDTLYHRVRERVGDAGVLERAGGQVRLALGRPLFVPDPRCSPPPEHSLLTVLAEHGHASVRAAAAALGIPLRTAQHALRSLAAEGICRVERDGRELRYVLEDTTFSEPTQTTQFE